MKRTDKEIVSAMEFIKSQHNGELPYKFGTFECAKMMAKYLIEQLELTAVGKGSETFFCGNCGNKRELIIETDINSRRICKNRLCKAK